MRNAGSNRRLLLSICCAACIFACGGCYSVPVSSSRTQIVPRAIIPATISPQAPCDDLKGVENFGVISADVWRGAKPTAEGLKTLADMGVRTVIDLRQDSECADIPPGVRYVRLPVSAWHSDQVCTSAVLKAIKDNPKPVFIHCTQGRDRTGLAIAAYRLSQGMSQEDAMTEVSNFRANFWWYQPIKRRVENLAKEMKKSPAP